MRILEDIFEPGDLTPLEPLEEYAFGLYKSDPSKKHAKTASGNKHLCEHPELSHENCLPGEVNCVRCRELWHMQVSGLYWLLQQPQYEKYRQSALRKYLEHAAVSRKCCVGCDHWLNGWLGRDT